MKNKRTAGRKKKCLPLIFSSGSMQFTGYSSNFSYTGLFIKTRKPLKSGVPVEISFNSNKECKMCLTGLSVRAINVRFPTNKNGMGVKLISQSEEYRGFIKELFLLDLQKKSSEDYETCQEIRNMKNVYQCQSEDPTN